MMAYVYLPDDEIDTCEFNGTTFTLLPNQTTEFVDHVADEKARTRIEDAKVVKIDGKDYKSVVVSPWPKFKGHEIAEHIALKLSMWGTAVTAGPVTDGKPSVKKDQTTVDQAEKTYLTATKTWCEEGIMLYEDKQKPRRLANLPVEPEGELVEKQRAWLKKYHKRLKEVGLVV